MFQPKITCIRVLIKQKSIPDTKILGPTQSPTRLQSEGGSTAGQGAGVWAGVEQQIESQQWTYPHIVALSACTRWAESIKPTGESIWVHLRKIERVHPGRIRKKRWRRSRAANQKPRMDVPQCPCLFSMYLTRRTDSAWRQTNQSRSATVRNQLHLEWETEGETEGTSRAATREPMIDVPQYPSAVLM